MSGTKGKYLNADNLIEYKVSDHSQDISKQLCGNLSADSNKDRMSQILCSHNSLVTVQLTKELYRNATSLERLEKYALKKGTPGQKVEQAIDALRLGGNILK
jgi:SRSO17 transposase